MKYYVTASRTSGKTNLIAAANDIVMQYDHALIMSDLLVDATIKDIQERVNKANKANKATHCKTSIDLQTCRLPMSNDIILSLRISRNSTATITFKAVEIEITKPFKS